MITKEEYQNAVSNRDAAQEIINNYTKQKLELFEERLKTNPIFKDTELFYSRSSRCPCGAGLAYPKECSPLHYWDCSAILLGKADKHVKHTAQLPFSMYDIKGERENESTRP
jgi:hypothetical protein